MNLLGRHPQRGLKRAAVLVHPALGVGAGLWPALVSLTGGLIVFRAGIEAAKAAPIRVAIFQKPFVEWRAPTPDKIPAEPTATLLKA